MGDREFGLIYGIAIGIVALLILGIGEVILLFTEIKTDNQVKVDINEEPFKVIHKKLNESARKDSLHILKLDSIFASKDSIIDAKLNRLNKLDEKANITKKQNETYREQFFKYLSTDTTILDSLRRKHFN